TSSPATSSGWSLRDADAPGSARAAIAHRAGSVRRLRQAEQPLCVAAQDEALVRLRNVGEDDLAELVGRGEEDRVRPPDEPVGAGLAREALHEPRRSARVRQLEKQVGRA